MTSVEFKLPSLGEGVDSADVAELLVREGDVVEADQPVVELETEKAVMEVPSPCAGQITKVHIAEGETISVGQLLLTIEASEGGQPSVDAASASPLATNTTADPSASEIVEAEAANTVASEDVTEETTPSADGQLLEFMLPNLGEGIETADVAEVLVSVGETIKADQPVMELETEKAVMQVPCPFAGVIEEISVRAGDSVGVGQAVLAVRSGATVEKPSPKPVPAKVVSPADS